MQFISRATALLAGGQLRATVAPITPVPYWMYTHSLPCSPTSRVRESAMAVYASSQEISSHSPPPRGVGGLRRIGVLSRSGL